MIKDLTDINHLRKNLHHNISEALNSIKLPYTGLRYNRAEVMVGDNSINVHLSFSSNINQQDFKRKISLKFDGDKFQKQSNLANEIQTKIDMIVSKHLKTFESDIIFDITKILHGVK